MASQQGDQSGWQTAGGRNKSFANAVNSGKQKSGLSSSSSNTDQEIVFLPPLFLFNKACPHRVTNLDICQAAARLLGYNGTVAAQRFGPLWHLFPKSMKDRADLAGKQIQIENKFVEIFQKTHLIW